MKRAYWVSAVGCLLFVATAFADTITAGNTTYSDVLVTETPSFFYVQIPEEGRTVSVPREDVVAGSLQINDDPFYRDELKAKYELRREQIKSGEFDPGNPAFRAGASGGRPDASALLRGGASGNGGARSAGAGMARTELETIFSGFGVVFQDGPARDGNPTRVGRMPNGTSIELVGPPDRLLGLTIRGEGPPQLYTGTLAQIRMYVAQSAPGAVAQLDALMSDAETSGVGEVVSDGVRIRLQRNDVGENIRFVVSIMQAT